MVFRSRPSAHLLEGFQGTCRGEIRRAANRALSEVDAANPIEGSRYLRIAASSGALTYGTYVWPIAAAFGVDATCHGAVLHHQNPRAAGHLWSRLASWLNRLQKVAP